jgi:hydrogenase maturation factor
MKFIDEYRQGDIAEKPAAEIAHTTRRPLKFMEVCGGHTARFSASTRSTSATRGS